VGDSIREIKQDSPLVLKLRRDRFDGQELVMNFSTSAVGSAWVEAQDQAGNPISGFTSN
jgi:hypothetical protein